MKPLNIFATQFNNYCQESKEGPVRRRYGPPQTPLARVLASPQVSEQTKAELRRQKACLNPFALKRQVDQRLKSINAIRRPRP
jgi:hypothetical protein